MSLKSDELTPNQKKLLIRILVENGASQSFVYVRFFEKGFSEWELRGVDNIKRTFIAAQAPAGQARQAPQRSSSTKKPPRNKLRDGFKIGFVVQKKLKDCVPCP